MLLGILLMVSGWLLVAPGGRKHRALPVLGTLIITAAMLSIVQARY